MNHEEEIAVLREKTTHHKEKINKLEDLQFDLYERLREIAITTEKHSEQLATLVRIIYGSLALLASTTLTSLATHHFFK